MPETGVSLWELSSLVCKGEDTGRKVAVFTFTGLAVARTKVTVYISVCSTRNREILGKVCEEVELEPADERQVSIQGYLKGELRVT